MSLVRVVEPGALRAELLTAGHRVGDLRLLSDGGSLVFRDDHTVVRLGSEDLYEAMRVLGRAAQLSVGRAPVLAPLHIEPVRTSYGIATLWPVGYPSRDPVRDLAQACRGLHAVMTSQSEEDRTRDVLRSRLRDLGAVGIDEAVHQELMDRASTLSDEPGWDPVGGFVHGDAHPGNVVLHNSVPTLIDLASMRSGPIELDFIPLWSAARRGRNDWSHWQSFQDGYGDPVVTARLNDWPHLEEALLERELTTTIFLAQYWQRRPWVRDEVRIRLRSWDDATNGERWNTGL